MTTFKDALANTGRDTWQVAVAMFCALLFGLVAVAVVLSGNGTVASGLMWAAAWSAIGWLLGFLFGIPRFLSTDTARKPGGAVLDQLKQQFAAAQAHATQLHADNSQAASVVAQADADAETAKQKLLNATLLAPAASGQSLTVNTNLEQISDWLTKIIVGVSLVEWRALCKNLHDTAVFMSVSLVGTSAGSPTSGVAATSNASSAASSAASALAEATSQAASAAVRAVDASGHLLSCSSPACGAMESFALALLLYFLTIGILGSYLLTRLFLQQALDNAAHLA